MNGNHKQGIHSCIVQVRIKVCGSEYHSLTTYVPDIEYIHTKQEDHNTNTVNRSVSYTTMVMNAV